MQLLDHFLWRDTNRRNEQLCFAGNNNIHELVELAFSIIVLHVPTVSELVQCATEQWRAYVRLPRVPSDLWQSKVDTKRCILVLEL